MRENAPITIAGLTKRFGDRTILDGIHMEVAAGETVALIGPSGSGKSTVLRCINGLTGFEGGEIRVGEHTLRANDANRDLEVQELRRLVGMVFQDFRLFPHLTVVANIMEAPRLVRGLSEAKARAMALELLERVGLRDRADTYPKDLSGGQKQRVAIARALAMEPRGLLCDEITSALDPELKHEVLEVLADLKGDGLTLMVVTHEIGFARRVADRVFFLANGRIVEEGPPSQVIDNPAQERTRQFLQRMME